jgi:hypothetical protein
LKTHRWLVIYKKYSLAIASIDGCVYRSVRIESFGSSLFGVGGFRGLATGPLAFFVWGLPTGGQNRASQPASDRAGAPVVTAPETALELRARSALFAAQVTRGMNCT